MTRIPASVRQAVRNRAQGRCEYCRIPESAGFYAFHVEHIRPLKHSGSSDLDNLAWACAYCNIYKGSDIAAFEVDSDSIVPLFNPRTQQWDDHFSLKEGLITGTTPVGQATADLLQFNHPRQIESRAILIHSGLW